MILQIFIFHLLQATNYTPKPVNPTPSFCVLGLRPAVLDRHACKVRLRDEKLQIALKLRP